MGSSDVVGLHAQITAWTRGLFELSPSELAAALAFLEGYELLLNARVFPGLVPLTEADRLLLLADISVFVWLDDTFAASKHREPVRWSGLVLGNPGPNREARVFDHLHSAIRARGGDPAALDLWQSTGVAFLELQERDWMQRQQGTTRQWTFLDYIAEAEVNSTIQHMLATLSLLHGLDMHKRMEEATFRR